MTLPVMVSLARSAMSRAMSSCASVSSKETGPDGGWAWQCCNIAVSPHGYAYATDWPMRCALSVTGRFQPRRSRQGRQISWSVFSRAWRSGPWGGGDRW
jgi:hypothetical protein